MLPPKGDSCILPFIWHISPEMCFVFLFFFSLPLVSFKSLVRPQSEPKSLLRTAWSSYCVSGNCTLCICWGRIRGPSSGQTPAASGNAETIAASVNGARSAASVRHEVK